MDTVYNMTINDELADQILSNPDEYEKLKSHCEGLNTVLNFDSFQVTDNSGRIIYTSTN